MISGLEVMLKDQSTFKKSTGDEAATKSLGMGVVTQAIEGKVSFVAWSMDVRFESKNVSRHLDMMVHNEQCLPANTPMWPYLSEQAKARGVCSDEQDEVDTACSGDGNDCPPCDSEKSAANFGKNKCVQAKRCMLVPYSPNKCCDGQTPHHLIPKHHFSKRRRYKADKAPCVCVEGQSWHEYDDTDFPDELKTHVEMHDYQDACERAGIATLERWIARGKEVGARTPKKALDYTQLKRVALDAHEQVFTKCSRGCLSAQLDAYHKQTSVGVKEGDLLVTKKVGRA